MGIANVMDTGRLGMTAAKASVATAGHNISNAATEGFSRQRVETVTNEPQPGLGAKNRIGRGVLIGSINRINDGYLEKQLRTSKKDLAHFEEKDLLLNQVEGIFNELDSEGLNRQITKFFNDFRQLGNEPEREALREAVRESSRAVTKDFQRLNASLKDVTAFADARIEAAVKDLNSLSEQLKGLNLKIKSQETGGGSSNDLRDQRDEILKKINEYIDVSSYEDEKGSYVVGVRNVGPLVVGGATAEKFTVHRSPANERGKQDGAFDINFSSYADNNVTHLLKGGKLGALLEVRDEVVSKMQTKLDDLAYHFSNSVNEIHQQGVTRSGIKGVNFFKTLNEKKDAAEYIGISDAVNQNLDNIAAAAVTNAPGDNRVALMIAGLQHSKPMANGTASFDDFFNSIVSDMGVIRGRNTDSLTQQGNVVRQLGKMREQISGVSIDEETANLMQFQHIYDASARVIKVADEMLKTILELGPNR